jgi:hypothetical protein
MGFTQALIIVALSLSVGTSFAQAGSPKNIQDRGKAMLRDAEEMVMHGGMGDGKAIVHHCGEVTIHAEAILKVLPLTDEHGSGSRASFTGGHQAVRKEWLRWEIRSILEPV